MIKLFCNSSEIPLDFWTFPGGERGLKIPNIDRLSIMHTVRMGCEFAGSDDLIDMLLLVDAIRSYKPDMHIQLRMPYMPFARQDRVMTPGEPFSLRVAANLIKSCNFSKITTWDVHSDVFLGMFGPGEIDNIEQHEIWAADVLLNASGPMVLVSPDGGALKKIHKLAESIYKSMPFGKHVPVVIEAQKVRDVATGEITKTSIDHNAFLALSADSVVYVVDDICDGGRTFIELGKEIRKVWKGELYLFVTHGIFSKGKECLYEYYDSVSSKNDVYLDY